MKRIEKSKEIHNYIFKKKKQSKSNNHLLKEEALHVNRIKVVTELFRNVNKVANELLVFINNNCRHSLTALKSDKF